MKEKRILIPAILAALAVVILVVLIRNHQAHCPQCFHLPSFSPEVLKHFILGFGPWALGVFIILYALNTVSLLPPIGIMSLAAGFIFGPFYGSVGIMAGAFLGTTATFFIARFFGSQFVDSMIKGKAREFQQKLDQNGFKVILFIRLIPLIPWEVVNYASGLSQIKYRDFILATLIGIFPSVLIQTFFTDRLSKFNWKDPTFMIALGAFMLLGAVPAIYLKRKDRTAKATADNPSGAA